VGEGLAVSQGYVAESEPGAQRRDAGEGLFSDGGERNGKNGLLKLFVVR